jgi:hypothetical protein
VCWKEVGGVSEGKEKKKEKKKDEDSRVGRDENVPLRPSKSRASSPCA